MTAISAKRSRLKGYCGSLSKIAEARRIACGPKRVPGLFEVAASKGIPQTATSTPASSLVKRRRMKDSAPAKVGSLAAEVRLVAVKAWSIDLFAKSCSFFGRKTIAASDAGVSDGGSARRNWPIRSRAERGRRGADRFQAIVRMTAARYHRAAVLAGLPIRPVFAGTTIQKASSARSRRHNPRAARRCRRRAEARTRFREC